MKKHFLCLLLSLCLGLSGCIQLRETVPGEETTLTDEMAEVKHEYSLEDFLDEMTLLESPVHEYGEEAGYIQFEEDMVARILYPEGPIERLHNAITDWVTQTVQYYQEESYGSYAYGESAELTVEYDSYIVNNDVISVKFTGAYDKPFQEHPIDIIAAFHASSSTGELLTLADVLHSEGINRLTEMVIHDASVDEELVDEHLLDLWIMTADGIEITLERGDYLPMSAGTVKLLYSYDQIGEFISLEQESMDETILETNQGETELPESSLPNKIPVESITQIPNIDPSKPMIALTFDDGPSQHTERLLNILQTNGAKGTFFVVGNLLDIRSDVVQRIAAEGHEIGGHSWNHRQLTNLSEEELIEQIMVTRAKINEITGVDSGVIRPPYGSFDDQLQSVCEKYDMIMVNWSVDTLDWKYKDPDVIYNTIMAEVKEGAIILCHDLHGTTVDAMERVIPELVSRGYQLVTVTELLSYGNIEITAGNVYFHGAANS